MGRDIRRVIGTGSDPVRTEPAQPVDLRAAWEDQSEAWTQWARAPLHDSYWRFGRTAFFELLPPPGRLTIDVGCGEGRVSRDLMALGHRVIGIDASKSMVEAAIGAAPQIPALVADAADLPFASGCGDLVVAYMALQDIDDMDAAIGEIGRVLVTGGHLCLAIVHPINSAGQFESLDPAAPFVIEGSYLESYQYAEEIERSGLRMTFSSIHHPLQAYFRALEANGFLTETLREVPIPEGSASDASPRHERWRRLPLFLHMRAIKV
jgi:SAM-dependent methyltransferase